MKKAILIIFLLINSIVGFSQLSVTIDSLRQKSDTLWFTNRQGSVVYFRTTGDSLFLGDVNGEVYSGEIGGSVDIANIPEWSVPFKQGDSLSYDVNSFYYKNDTTFKILVSKFSGGNSAYITGYTSQGSPYAGKPYLELGTGGGQAIMAWDDSTMLPQQIIVTDSLILRYLSGNSGKVLTLSETGGVYASDASGGGIKPGDTITNSNLTFIGQDYGKNNIKITIPDSVVLDGSANSGTDLEFAHTYEAFKFTPAGNITVLSLGVYVKKTGTITNVTDYLQAWIYSDNAGVPDAAISNITEYERFGYITASYAKYQCQQSQLNLIAGTAYWIVIKRNAAPTGGTVYLDTKNTGTAQYAYSTNGSAWTAADNVTGRFELYAPTVPAILVQNKNYAGIRVDGTTEYAFHGTCIWDYPFLGEAINYDAFVGTSVYGSGSRFLSIHGPGSYSTSTNSYGHIVTSTNANGGYSQTYSRNAAHYAWGAFNFGAGIGMLVQADSSYGIQVTAKLDHGIYSNILSGAASSKAAVYGLNSGTGIGVRGTGGVGAYLSSTAGHGAEVYSTSGIPLYVQNNNAGTTTVTSLADFYRYSSGTAAAGIGSSLNMYVQNGSGTGKLAGKIESTLTTVTANSEEGNIKLGTIHAGANVDRLIEGSKTLTDGSATGICTIALPTTATAGGRIEYSVHVTSAAGDSVQVYTGQVKYSASNIGGVYVSTIRDGYSVADCELDTAGTYAQSTAALELSLTKAWTISTGTNTVTVNANFNTNIGVATIKIYYTIYNESKRAITIL